MRVSGMHRILFGAVIGVTGMALAVPVSTLGAGAASTVKVYAPGTVGIVAPTTGPTAGALGQTATHSSRAAHALPHATSNSPAAAAVPNVSGITPAVASSLLANFNGTSSNDSRTTNFNQEFEPPDQGLCVGNGYVLEPVNSAYRIFKTNGRPWKARPTSTDLFDQGLTQFTSDPRCFYDPATNTWFATILFLSGGEAVDGIVAARHRGEQLGQPGEPLDCSTRSTRPMPGERLPLLRRPADARHRPGQPLRHHQRVLDPRPAVQRRPGVRLLEEGPRRRGADRTSCTSAISTSAGPLRHQSNRRSARARRTPSSS